MRTIVGKKYGLATAFFAVVFATFTATVCSQGASIAQGYTAGKGVTNAALVSAEGDDPSAVTLANIGTVGRLVGVVGSNPGISLASGQTGAQVITSGIAYALVSNINGDIKAGDVITASPINGVGMKALEDTTILGIAQKDLSSTQFEKRSVTDKSGKSRDVLVGLMPVQVKVTHYTFAKARNYVPGILQNFADRIAGKNVSTTRVMVSALILLLIFVSATALFYASVRSSIISIGRNPLSEGAVRKGLLQVGLIVLMILILGCVAIYFTLKS